MCRSTASEEANRQKKSGAKNIPKKCKKKYKWNLKKFAIAAILVEKERKKNDAMDGFLFTWKRMAALDPIHFTSMTSKSPHNLLFSMAYLNKAPNDRK